MRAGARKQFTLHTSSGNFVLGFPFFPAVIIRHVDSAAGRFFYYSVAVTGPVPYPADWQEVTSGDLKGRCKSDNRAAHGPILEPGLTFGPGKRDLKTTMDSTGFEPIKSRWLPPFEPGRTFGPGKRDLKTAMDSTGFEPVAFTLQT